MEVIDFGIPSKGFRGVGLKGSLEDFSSDALHVHPFHQVLQISQGVALLEDGTLTRPQYGFLTAFIPARFPHRTRVLGDAVQYQSLYFSRNLSKRMPATMVIFRMSELGSALLKELNCGESLRTLKTGMDRDCLHLFVQVLERDIRNEQTMLELRAPAGRVSRILCDYLEKHHAHRVSAAGCANAASLSFRQLSRGFRAEMGMTVFEYLRTYRMLKASVLLNTTDGKILDVAYQCGYDSVSSFFTDFRKTFSCSPVQFRKLRGNDKTSFF